MGFLSGFHNLGGLTHFSEVNYGIYLVSSLHGGVHPAERQLEVLVLGIELKGL